MENIEETEDGTEDEDYEPQVTSSNKTERIAARRLRIQRRIEAIKKQKAALEAELEGEVLQEEEKTPIQVQMDKSCEFLERLVLDGDEFVTNVRIANEAREADRREREGIGKEKLLKELEEEAAAAEEMFNQIADKWSAILKFNDPLNINDEMNSQKDKCDELIRQKDAIIATLRSQVRSAEINFALDQRKQVEDINSLARRIENQITVMRRAFREELKLIEEVMLAERQILVESNNKKWEELAKKRDFEENALSDKKFEELEKFQEDMKKLQYEFQEAYRDAKINMNNDIDELQREFERIKTLAVMNSEKLDYNYQILKKREDENIIIKSQQKRRMNKLQDIINSLRKTIFDYKASTFAKIAKLTEDIKNLRQSILDVEAKADHFASVNDQKFKQIWEMNQTKANDLYRQILNVDRILHEHQLGISWKAPDWKTLSSSDLVSCKSALQVVAELYRKDKTVTKNLGPSDFIDSFKFLKEETETYRKIVKKILNQVSLQANFLVEDQLEEILKPYTESEKALVKVDNVFAALEVRKREDIDLLLIYFLPYMYCPICSTSMDFPSREEVIESEENIMDEEIKEEEFNFYDIDDIGSMIIDPSPVSSISSRYPQLQEAELIADKSAGFSKQVLTAAIDFAGPLQLDDHLEGECKGPDLAEERAKELELEVANKEAEIGEKVSCRFHHPLLISPIYILKALKEFLGVYHVARASLPTMSARLSQKRSTVSRLVNESDIGVYWKKFSEIFPKEKEQLWDSLLAGLKRYHELLKARKLASEQVLELRKQNRDLRKLFANYLAGSDDGTMPISKTPKQLDKN